MRTSFVALVLPTLTISNFADTAQGLADALGARYQLLIGYTLYRTDEEERMVRSLLSRRPEAIVMAGSHHSAATRRMLADASIPVVEVWDRPEPPLDLSVGFSNEEAGRLAARHLLDLGYRQIGAIGSAVRGNLVDQRGEARLRGFSAALRDAGLSDRFVLRHGAPPVSLTHGADAISALLSKAPDIEAVFAVSDVSAFGALMECRRRGIDVPAGLSIVGFGDFELGRQCEPPISTIGIDSRGIGTRTGERLLALFAQKRRQHTAHDGSRCRDAAARDERAAPRARHLTLPATVRTNMMVATAIAAIGVFSPGTMVQTLALDIPDKGGRMVALFNRMTAKALRRRRLNPRSPAFLPRHLLQRSPVTGS